MGTSASGAVIALACSLPYVDDPMWEYQVVEEPNPIALQERLGTVAHDGWEAINLVCAAECRLLALVRRRVTVSGERPHDIMEQRTQNGSRVEDTACDRKPAR